MAITLLICLQRFLLFGKRDFGFEVATDEELQEQKEVAPIHDKGRSVVFFFDAAFLVGGVVVESKNGANDADNHLGNLEERNDHRIEPLRAEFHGHQEVIPVHRSMDAVIHRNKDDSGG